MGDNEREDKTSRREFLRDVGAQGGVVAGGAVLGAAVGAAAGWAGTRSENDLNSGPTVGELLQEKFGRMPTSEELAALPAKELAALFEEHRSREPSSLLAPGVGATVGAAVGAAAMVPAAGMGSLSRHAKRAKERLERSDGTPRGGPDEGKGR